MATLKRGGAGVTAVVKNLFGSKHITPFLLSIDSIRASLGGLGAVLARLGAVLGRLGAVLEPSWDDLGAVLGPDGLSGGVLVPN